MGIVRLCNITFGYGPGSKRLFEGLDVSFTEGERAGLVGANGSGKTTLFHIIMGLLTPESGHVEVFGLKPQGEEDFRKVRSQLGLLFQDPDDQLFCPTVAEDVAFGPLNLGASRSEARRIVADTLKLLGLEGFEQRTTFKLSGGEKRLVSLAAVLAMKPRMLLLDEPTAGLDEATTDRLVKILGAPGLSYVIISHDRDFLARTVNTTWSLAGGRATSQTPAPAKVVGNRDA
ncbi:MAG: ABC transporter ATP-binding protein [Pseudomonadota bacterium]